jgi:hypothetical protein
MKSLERLRQRALACGAGENYRDAARDLAIWPEYRRQIIADLKASIEAHEMGDDDGQEQGNA